MRELIDARDGGGLRREHDDQRSAHEAEPGAELPEHVEPLAQEQGRDHRRRHHRERAHRRHHRRRREDVRREVAALGAEHCTQRSTPTYCAVSVMHILSHA